MRLSDSRFCPRIGALMIPRVTVKKLTVDMSLFLQNFSFSVCATKNPNLYLNTNNQIQIFGSVKLNSISQLQCEKHILAKNALISAPEKKTVALPDPIHNTTHTDS